MGMHDKGTITFGLRELELAERKGLFKSLFHRGKGVKDLIAIAKACNCISTRVSEIQNPNYGNDSQGYPFSLNQDLPASSFLTIEFLKDTRDRLKKINEAR